MNARFVLALVVLSSLFLSGCASSHLRFNTVQHAETLSDIYEIQVLNNIARFKVNPHATPHFEIPDSGGTDIEGDVNLETGAFNTFRTQFGASTSRTGTSSWVLNPVTDPNKLFRMKCAYQRTVGYSQADSCDSCCDEQKKITLKEKTRKDSDDMTFKEVCYDPCSANSCWFACSRKIRDAKASGCQFGEYRGLYVWVPKSGQADFSQLVFDILRYATKDPASAAKKEVTLYLDSNGNPTQPWLASQVVKGEIAVTKENSGLAANSEIPADADRLSELITKLTGFALKNSVQMGTQGNKLNPLELEFKGPEKEQTDRQRKINEQRIKAADDFQGSPVNSVDTIRNGIRGIDFNQRFLLPE